MVKVKPSGLEAVPKTEKYAVGPSHLPAITLALKKITL
jgi:hypothetical protein